MRSRMVVVTTVLVCMLSLVASGKEKKAEAADKEKKNIEVPAEGAKGDVTGIIKKIDGGKITVKSKDGTTVFIPYWRGGAPKDGGGFDKDMMKTLEEFKVGDKVTISWTMQEHQRIDSIIKVEKKTEKTPKK